jgi:malate dehydrogenase (oxaloacetate-decarboxylating)
LPPLTELPELSKRIAFAVGKVALKQNLALEISDQQLLERIEENFWQPVYRHYKRVCF